MKSFNDIKYKELNEGLYDPNIFKAFFLAGGPGSGKTFVTRSAFGGTGLRMINSDNAFEIALKKNNLSLKMPDSESEARDMVRARAKATTSGIMDLSIAGRLGMIVDGTGRDYDKIKSQVAELRQLGYDCYMIFVNTSLDVAQERNTQRARSLPTDMVKTMWKEVQDNIMKFQQGFGASNFHIVDNSGGLEDPARKENFDQVYRTIQKFINTPPSKRQAKAWIKNAQQAKTQG